MQGEAKGVGNLHGSGDFQFGLHRGHEEARGVANLRVGGDFGFGLHRGREAKGLVKLRDDGDFGLGKVEDMFLYGASEGW